MSKIGKSIETKDRLVLTQGSEEGRVGSKCLKWTAFPFEVMKKYWRELHSGDGIAGLRKLYHHFCDISLMRCTEYSWIIDFKMVKMVNFMVYVIYHNKKYHLYFQRLYVNTKMKQR